MYQQIACPVGGIDDLAADNTGHWVRHSLGENADTHIGMGHCQHIHKIGVFPNDGRLCPCLSEPASDFVDPGVAMGHNERVACQLFQRQRYFRLCRQRVLVRKNGAPRLIAHVNALQMLAVIGCCNDAQLDDTP